jgi:hypothetical protein
MTHAGNRALQSSRDPARPFAVMLQQMPGHALRRLDADARQPSQGLDQTLERGFDGH